MIRLAALSLLALAGCDNTRRLMSRSEVEQIAADEARDAQAESPRIEALYRRMREVEDKVTALERRSVETDERLSENANISNGNARLLDRRWDIYLNHTH